ncbi:protein containing Peptidase M23 domain protein, partial [human gut metagenome]
GINNTKKNTESVTDEVYKAGQSVQSENGDSEGYGSSITYAGQGVRNYFVSDKGVALAWPGNKTPSIKDVKLKTDELQSSHSPLHEWFKVTSGRNAWTEPGGWYYRRNNQTEQGKGTTGDYHCGVDIHTDNDDDGESPVYSTTGGVVTHVSDKESNSTGWSIQWKDSANMFHTYMHLNEKPSFDVDDKLEPGAFVGHIGNTPKKEGMGYHLHYQISRVPWPVRGEDMADTINPFTYFKYNENSENASENEIVSGDVKMSGSTTKEQIFTGLTSLGMSKIGAAGIMGCLAHESAYQSNNLQNSFNDKYGVSDKEYTDLVNSKKESKDEFIHGRYSEDDETVGYGLAQFTSSNLKKDLYELTVEHGRSIDDMGCQLAEIVRVLKSRDYGSTTLYDAINNAETPTEANKYFLWRYEAGTGFNSDEEVVDWYPGWVGKVLIIVILRL